MAALAATELEPDATEVQVEVVVDDHDVGRRHRVERGQRAHLAARLVHVAARLCQHHRVSRQPASNDFGPGTLVPLEFRAQPRGQQVGNHEAEVVPGARVAVSGVAEADDQEGLGHVAGRLLGLFCGGFGF